MLDQATHAKSMLMIVSGSLVPGVDAADFRLPAHTAFRLEMPDPSLRDYIDDYHILDSDEHHHADAQEYILPSWPAIRINLSANRMGLKIGSKAYDPIPVASLYGTTTKAMLATPHGGVTIGISLTPLGWARLFSSPASHFRDDVVPLETVLAPSVVAQLVDSLIESNQSTDVKPILDNFLLSNMRPIQRDEEAIRKLLRLLEDPATQDLATSCRAYGISAKQLSRISNRYFGYPPKRLLMRTRFMRSFLPMFCTYRQCDFTVIDQDYVDASHFLRDAKRFLGMTPARFMMTETPYLDAVLRARRIVLTAASHKEKKLVSEWSSAPSYADTAQTA